MSFTPRPYQTEAINAGISFFHEKKQGNGIVILPTGAGKSIVIANIAAGLTGKTLVFQPSKEILEQNYKKYTSYGYRAGIYSASAGVKFLDNVTFATIGSVARKHHLFRQFNNIIVDECHLCNANQGQYNDFFDYMSHAKVLGLTATPYRLASGGEGAELRFITRTSPRIFNKVIYYVQNNVLFDAGHLAKLEYFPVDLVDRTRLQMNSSGTDFTESSVRSYYRAIDMPRKTGEYANRILAKRKNLLVFCTLLEEARTVCDMIAGAVMLSGDTPAGEREKMLRDFTSGRIRCVVNVGVLTTGFDYPELEAVLIARSTMSMSLYYQMVGRVMRPHKNKLSGWVVDMGGNIKMFGEIETMKIERDERGLYFITNNGKQLTNVPFEKV